MKPLLALLAITPLCLGTTGCGAGRGSTGSAPRAATGGGPGGVETTAAGVVYDSDDAPIRFYGHEATPTDRQAIEAVVKRYYAAAAREDGAAGCALMNSLTAETIPEDFEHLRDVHAKTCAAIMLKLFEERHPELVHDSATLEVIDVRAEDGKALALLRFARGRELSHFAIHREGPTWKIWEEFADHMP